MLTVMVKSFGHYALCLIISELCLSHSVSAFFFGSGSSTMENGFVDVSYQNLTEFPGPEHFQNAKLIKTLDLSHNNIQHIPVINNSNVQTITALNLSHNLIKRIESYAFRNFTSLVELDLSYNKLEGSNIRGDDITYELGSFPKLKRLTFQGNPLGYVQKFTFTNFEFTRLEYLDLSNCSIKTLEDLSIDSLIRLKHLNLSYNHLTKFTSSPFTGLSELEVLDLSYNKVEVILDIPLFTSLLYLNLDNNILKSIKDNALSSAVKLHTLSLRRNNLRTMTHLTLPTRTVRVLHLDDNPWACDCRLKWVRSDAEEDLKNKTSSIICTYPSWYRGRDIFSLSEDELTCAKSFLGALAALILSATLSLVIGGTFIILWRKRKSFKCFSEKGGNYSAVYTRDADAEEENAIVTFSDEKSLVNNEESV